MGDDVDNNKNVKTSDESNPYLYMLSALLSILGIIYLTETLKKLNKSR